jgi:hypothetical protein
MTDLKPTYADYLIAVDKYRANHALRWGQCYYNVLYSMRPNLANTVRSTAADPFYSDDRIDDFLIFVQVNWSIDD